jgi:hypothetical protein
VKLFVQSLSVAVLNGRGTGGTESEGRFLSWIFSGKNNKVILFLVCSIQNALEELFVAERARKGR